MPALLAGRDRGQKGRVVFVSSELAYLVEPFVSAYSVAKLGMSAYADALRVEYGTELHVTAVEEHPDGAENTASEDLLWDYEGDDVIITLTRDYLRPDQTMTLRWNVGREPA